MAVADSSVKFMHWLQSGAPTLSGAAGSLTSLLDALLVNGFGVGAPSSVIVAGNVCTMTYAGAHPHIRDGVVRVSGVTTPAALNADWKVKAVTGLTVTFDTSGISDQTATGAVSTKVAPLGWTKVFTGTNKAAYKSSDPAACGQILRVDNTATAISARVRGYSAMTDVDTGADPFPTDAQISGGGYWDTSTTANAVTRPWIFFGDSRIFYLHVDHYTLSSAVPPYVGGDVVMFGEGVKTHSADLYATQLVAAPSAGGTTGSGFEFASTYGASTSYAFYARPMLNLGSAVEAMHRHDGMPASNQFSSGSSSGKPFPTYDGKIRAFKLRSQFDPISGRTGLNTMVDRMLIPGLYTFDVNIGLQFRTFDIFPAFDGELSGRNVMALRCNSNNSLNNARVIGVDLTGPWR